MRSIAAAVAKLSATAISPPSVGEGVGVGVGAGVGGVTTVGPVPPLAVSVVCATLVPQDDVSARLTIDRSLSARGLDVRFNKSFLNSSKYNKYDPPVSFEF